jgi:hypothetical protein
MNMVLFKPCSSDDLGKLVNHLNFSYVKNQENRLESLIQEDVSQNEVAIQIDQRSSINTPVQLMDFDTSKEDFEGLSDRSDNDIEANEANDSLPQWA